MGTTTDQLSQIGNGVPPKFAETLYRHLKRELQDADEEERRPRAAQSRRYIYEVGVLQTLFEEVEVLQTVFEDFDLEDGAEGSE